MKQSPGGERDLSTKKPHSHGNLGEIDHRPIGGEHADPLNPDANTGGPLPLLPRRTTSPCPRCCCAAACARGGGGGTAVLSGRSRWAIRLNDLAAPPSA